MGKDYDVIVVGGGPGGYVAAIQAAQRGRKTAVVESGSLGGTCLNVGCIPTKALIKGANVYEDIRGAGQYGIGGIDGGKVTVDLSRLQDHKDRVVKQLVNGVRSLLRTNGVTVIEGTAAFVDAATLQVGGKRLTGGDIIIATGSRPVIPAFIPLEGENRVLTSTELLSLRRRPAEMVIIGGGVIGIEFAYLFNRLGTKVTVVELAEHILPLVDQEIADMAQRRLAGDGVVFCLRARVQGIRDNCVFFEQDGTVREVSAEAILMAVGREPNTGGLNAEGIGLKFDGKAIWSDACQRTNLPHVYAIGDVNGRAMLAHTSFCEAEVAVDCICGCDREMDYRHIPSCIYVEPEIAGVGLTEEEARAQYGGDLKVGRFPMAANGKSLIEGDTDGMVKVILEGRFGEILGVHLYGKHVTEMIAEIAAAMQSEAVAEDILRTVHPHPSVSESLREAVLAAWTGRAIHSL